MFLLSIKYNLKWLIPPVCAWLTVNSRATLCIQVSYRLHFGTESPDEQNAVDGEEAMIIIACSCTNSHDNGLRVTKAALSCHNSNLNPFSQRRNSAWFSSMCDLIYFNILVISYKLIYPEGGWVSAVSLSSQRNTCIYRHSCYHFVDI